MVENSAKWFKMLRFGERERLPSLKPGFDGDGHKRFDLKNLTKGAGKMADMMIDLKNEFRHSVDAKNRLFIPAKHREMMGRDFVICRSIRGNCLKVYPREEWEQFTSKIAAVGGSKGDALRHYVYRFSIDGEPDAQGRVVLNEGLINHAQLKKEAVILGLGRYAEIWAAELYEAEMLKECREDIIDIADEFGF